MFIRKHTRCNKTFKTVKLAQLKSTQLFLFITYTYINLLVYIQFQFMEAKKFDETVDYSNLLQIKLKTYVFSYAATLRNNFGAICDKNV